MVSRVSGFPFPAVDGDFCMPNASATPLETICPNYCEEKVRAVPPTQSNEEVERILLSLEQRVGRCSSMVFCEEEALQLYTEGLAADKEEDLEKAFNLFMKASEEGSGCASYQVAVCYERGDGVLRDDEKAYAFFKRGATQGYSSAQYEWAMKCRSEGKIPEAFFWLSEADCNGDEYAWQERCLSTFEQCRIVGKKIALDRACYGIDGELNVRIMKVFEDMLHERYPRAFLKMSERFASCAETISVDTLVEGIFDLQKERVLIQESSIMNSVKHALRLLQVLAECGNRNAQWEFLVASSKSQGIDYERLEKAAVRYAHRGNCSVQKLLAQAAQLSDKSDEEKDKESFLFFKKAAEQGDSDAQYETGIRYLSGVGVCKNLGKACDWLEKAIDQGNKQFKAFLKRAEKARDGDTFPCSATLMELDVDLL